MGTVASRREGLCWPGVRGGGAASLQYMSDIHDEQYSSMALRIDNGHHQKGGRGLQDPGATLRESIVNLMVREGSGASGGYNRAKVPPGKIPRDSPSSLYRATWCRGAVSWWRREAGGGQGLFGGWRL